MSVESLTKAIKLSSSETQTLAIQAQIKTDSLEKKDNKKETTLEEFDRPNVDLICVIDKSGSMSGEKINLVK